MPINKNLVSFHTIAFLKDYNIEHTTQGQKATRNRVQVHCPFCIGSKKYHLGIHLTHGYANCWRCGPHSIISTIKELLHISWSECYKIMDLYKDTTGVILNQNIIKSANDFFKNPCVLEDLKEKHQKYLEDRNFNPEELKNIWGIRSSGPVSMYKHRIFIPIFYRGEIVSFQCRYTGISSDISKYLTCKPENEKVFHKDILYGLDQAISDIVVVVEGATDVWRLGEGAVATFGTNYSNEQVYQLSRYKKIYILFDPEYTAQKKANALGNELAFLGKEVSILEIPDFPDPGELPTKEASQLMQDIFLGKL